MAFEELSDFLGAEPLVLPIGGKRYTFPGEISARTWLKVQRLDGLAKHPDKKATAVSDMDQDELLRELCGGTLEKMLADGLTNLQLKAVLGTLVVFHLRDREFAEKVWNAQGEPLAPNRAARRKPTPQSPRGGSRAGSTTPAKATPGNKR